MNHSPLLQILEIMRFKIFIIFVGPSLLLMFAFIALPLASVLWQSLHLQKEQMEEVRVEKCTPTFTGQNCKTELQLKPIMDSNNNPMIITEFVGFSIYKDLLKTDHWQKIFNGDASITSLLDFKFYKALRFTITFTLITLPLVIITGLCIALAVNNLVESFKGPVIFVSLLPFIITPIIGALSIKWLFIGDGIMTNFLEYLTKTDISLFAQGWTIEILMLFYRVWHVAPFAFVVFYAGLQTVNQDVIESAIIDGASRFERLRYVIIPHLMPLIIFVSLINLMDSYRVFEEIIAFASEAYVISLQWLTYDFLTPDGAGNRAIARASASSMLTMIGIIILLKPMVIRVWRDHKS